MSSDVKEDIIAMYNYVFVVRCVSLCPLGVVRNEISPMRYRILHYKWPVN